MTDFDFEVMKYLLIIIVVIIIIGGLVSCSNNLIETEDSWKYSNIKVNGMTCIKWVSAGYVGGLTCNWDEYKGEVR